MKDFHVVRVPEDHTGLVRPAQWLVAHPLSGGYGVYAAIPVGDLVPGVCGRRATVRATGVEWGVTDPSPDDQVAVRELTALVTRWGLDPDARGPLALDEVQAGGPDWLLATLVLADLDRPVLLGLLAERATSHEAFAALHEALTGAEAASSDHLVELIAGGLGRQFVMLAIHTLRGYARQRVTDAVLAHASE